MNVLFDEITDQEQYMLNTMFTHPVAISAEGARIGIASCKSCGAAVLIDPRDAENMLLKHVRWHIENTSS